MIRDCLDVGTPLASILDQVSVHSLAETLIRFLESLAEPVIPFAMCAKCLENSASQVACKQLLAQLPPAHYNAFVYIVAFLRELLTHTEANNLTPEKLAVVFGAVLLRMRNEVGGLGSSKLASTLAKKKAVFVFQFLIDEDDPAMPTGRQ